MPAATTRPGDTITDALITATALERVSTKLGPAWRVRILSGHQRGRESLIFDTNIRTVTPQHPHHQPETP